MDDDYKITTQNENNNSYSIIFGPLENDIVNNLVSRLISKGYKDIDILVK